MASWTEQLFGIISFPTFDPDEWQNVEELKNRQVIRKAHSSNSDPSRWSRLRRWQQSDLGVLLNDPSAGQTNDNIRRRGSQHLARWRVHKAHHARRCFVDGRKSLSEQINYFTVTGWLIDWLVRFKTRQTVWLKLKLTDLVLWAERPPLNSC